MGVISQGVTDFTWVGSEPAGNFVDDPAWIHKPFIDGSISVSEPTPPQSVNLGGVVHGAMFNRQGGVPNPQGWCQHSGDFDGNKTHTQWPLSMSAGDRLTKAYSRTDDPANPGTITSWNKDATRPGVNNETNALFVTENLPDAETFAAATFALGSVPFKQTRFADLDACVAAAPSLPVGNFSSQVADYSVVFENGIDYWAPGYGLTYGATTGSGYQANLPKPLYQTGTNYGQNAAAFWGACGLLYISDAISAAEKKRILIRMISAGAQWHEGLKAAGLILGGNGAHHQFGFLPMMFYLYYTQKNFNDMLQYTPNHQLANTMLIDPSVLTNELSLFHNNPNWSMSTRARTITAKNSPTEVVISGSSDDDAFLRGRGAYLVRQSDMQKTLITSTINNYHYTLQNDMSPALQVGDTVCLTRGDINEYAEGDAVWTINTKQKVKNWAAHCVGQDALYRSIQFYSESLLVCKAMGWTGFNGYAAFEKYVEHCNSGSFPSEYPFEDHHQNIDGGKTFAKSFWDEHYSSLTGNPSLPDTLPAGQVNFNVTVP